MISICRQPDNEPGHFMLIILNTDHLSKNCIPEFSFPPAISLNAAITRHQISFLVQRMNIFCVQWLLEVGTWQTSSEKNETVNILGFVSHIVSVSTIKLCYYSKKATTICK